MPKAHSQLVAVTLSSILALSSCTRPAPTSSKPHLVQRVPADFGPAWSPNGEYVAYSHYQQAFTDTLVTGLYIVELASSTRRLLAEGRTLNPAWFGDSRRIAFTAGALFVVDINTAATSLLVPGRNYNPHVSPADTAITYDAPWESSTGSVVWVFTLASQSARDISAHGQGEWRDPQWSPDGTRILHYRYSGSANGSTELFTMDPTGQSSTQLTHDTINDLHPCWSPSGTMIAWTRSDIITQEIWLSSSDGTNPRRLTLGVSPAFSPDGSKIVFIDPYSTDGADLHVINVDGTGYRPL